MKNNKENKTKMQFLKTTDSSTAEMLRNSGYTELTEPSTTCYCFLNDGKLTFDGNEEIIKNIHYTNMLCI